MKENAGIHIFPCVTSVSNQTYRRETRAFLTVSPTKRCCSFVLAVGSTILRSLLCMAETSIIAQNLSFLSTCRALGCGIQKEMEQIGGYIEKQQLKCYDL